MDDSSLKTLKITSKKNEALVLSPPFNKKIKEYSLCVGSDVDGLQISASPTEGDAFVQVQKAAANGIVPVAEGQSDIIIKCDAADGSSANTVIHVFRPSANDSTLKGLQFSVGSLSPDFHRLETRYVLRVSPHITTTAISALPMNASSKIVKVGFNDKGEVSLLHGETNISFIVTSADETTKQTYTIAVQKTKCGSRLVLAKDSTFEKQDLCSLCTSILFLPRSKPSMSTCAHNFCLPCLELFAKKTSSADSSVPKYFLCPICCVESAIISVDSDEIVEKRVSSLKYACPFVTFGCTSVSLEYSEIPSHVVQCVSAPLQPTCKNCQDFKKDGILKALEGDAHKFVCTYQCDACQKKVSCTGKHGHDAYYCLTKRTVLPKSDPPEPSSWESTLTDKKSFPTTVEACVKAAEIHLAEYLATLSESWRTSIETSGSNPSQPSIQLLEKLAKLYATAISLNTENKKLRGGALDESLHIQLGLVQEELVACKSTFPPVEVKLKSKVNDNAAASASFMSDEVDGLLMSLGIAKNASDATKIEAMEEEYHRLLASGLSDQAAEVQGLHQWKVQQVNSASGAGGNAGDGGGASKRGEGGISNALEKYEHAVTINPNNADANYHLGRVHLLLGNHEKAQSHLEHAVANRPIFPQAYFLLAIAILSPRNPKLDLLPFCVKSLEDALTDFHANLWLNFKSLASNQKSIVQISKLCEDVLSPNSGYFSSAHILLSKGYLLSANPGKSLLPIQQLVSVLPQALATIPKRGSTFQSTALALCAARKHLLHLLPLCSTTNQTLDEFNLETILPTTLAITATKDSSQSAATVLTAIEQISQSIVYRSPQNARALTQLGKSKLDQVDGNPEFGKSARKLQDAIESFEAAAAMEMGEVAGIESALKVIQAQEWFAEQKKELEMWAMNSKPKEVAKVPAGGKAGAAGKKTTAPAAKPAPAAKTAPAAKAPPAGKGAPAKSAAIANAKAATGIPKSQGKDAVTKSSRPVSASKKGSTSKLTDKGASTKASKTSLTADANTAASSTAAAVSKETSLSSASNYETHLGLARAISKKYGFVEEANAKDPQLVPLLEQLTNHYKNAIKIKSTGHDAYIELGSLLERKISIRAAADLYVTFPFPELKDNDPNQDDLYLFSELGRCFMKEKRYKEPLLKECLIAEGRISGMPTLAKYVEALDGAGESKLLMAIYAGVNKKPADHPDLVPFFKSRYWM